MLLGRFAAISLVAVAAAALAPACSQGNGTGSCAGTLDVPDCWSGPFDLHPDFFAAVPTSGTDTLQLRIQHGGDYETFSDGLEILIDDAGEVRGDPSSTGAPRPSLLGMPLVVSLPSGVEPPGVPITANALPSIVHATLYLDASCRTQNDALYAVAAVSTNADGSCSEPDGGDPIVQCTSTPPTAPTMPDGGGVASDSGLADGGASVDAGAPAASLTGPVRTSTMTFNALFDGNPDESNPANLLTDATFHLFLADPREICPGGLGPPPRCRGELEGNMHFYFEQGRPAQPFP